MRKAGLFFFLLTMSIWAADINITIAEGDGVYYDKLLYKINLLEKNDDETALQKTLLYKLINLSSAGSKEKLDFVTPDGPKSYHNLFSFYLDSALLKSMHQKRLQEMRSHKKIVKRQIDLMTQDDATALSQNLQYAFYHKAEIIYTQKLKAREAMMQSLPTVFIAALPKATFDANQIQKTMDSIDSSYEELEVKIQKINLDKERLNLLERTDQANRLDASIAYLKQSEKELIKQKVATLFKLFTLRLHNKSDTTFDIEKQILDEVALLDDGGITSDLSYLLQSMSQEVLGIAGRIKGATLAEIKNVFLSLWATLSDPLFTINETKVSFFKIILALLVFILSFYLGALYKKLINKYIRKKRRMQLASRTLFANVGNYLIIISAFFISLNILGINLTSIALIAGALSVGIGFGLQNIVANFMAGHILMYDRRIKVGDYIEMPDQLRGHVMDIRMRSTTINTNSNMDVIVPNQDLIQKHVINWTMSDEIRRFDIPFSVAYGTQAEKVIDVVLEALQQSDSADLHESPKHKSSVVMVNMNRSSVDFELLVWLEGDNILYPKTTMSRFLILIYNALNANGIKIPFPQRDLHIRSVDEFVEFNVSHKDETINYPHGD